MDYRYLVETKNEFNNFLNNMLVSHIYNGIKGMLKYSDNVYLQIEEKKKRGSKFNNPGIVIIFKKTLEGISGLNNHEIEEEYMRIKNHSGFPEWFDLLVKASFKSYVLLLTWDPETNQSKYSDNKLYDSIVIKDFIHKCYITTCNYFKDNTELFINNRSNKKEMYEIIKKCIEIGMKKSLPYDEIIQEYLRIDFTNINKKTNNDKEITKVKNLVYNMINNNKYGGKNTISKKILTDDSFDQYKNDNKNDNNNDYNNNYNGLSKKEEVENFINLELINQKKINNMNNSISNTSDVLTRSNVKSKEFDNIIEEASRKSESDIDSNSGNNNENSITSETSLDEEINELEKNSEGSAPKIINSPPVIRKNSIERLDDDINVKKNSKIEVILNKNNSRTDKFDKLESYYDNLLR